MSNMPFAVTAFILAAIGTAVVANAAEIKVLSTAGMIPAFSELGPRFERATGHKLVVRFMAGPVVKREIDAGETFDVAISQPAVIDNLIREGKIAAGTRANIARSGIGLATRVDAPKPDISTVDAFKRTLLNARTVVHSSEGASGVYFSSLLDRLGITGDMKPKLRPTPSERLIETVAKSEAEMVVASIPAILLLPGFALVGPLPSELQTWIGFTGGVGSGAKEPEAAEALIRFLTAPEAIPVIKARGMEPG